MSAAMAHRIATGFEGRVREPSVMLIEWEPTGRSEPVTADAAGTAGGASGPWRGLSPTMQSAPPQNSSPRESTSRGRPARRGAWRPWQHRYAPLMQGAVTVHMDASRAGRLDAGGRCPQHRAVLAGDVRRGVARRVDRPTARCSVPRSCQAQRDRSGLLDDVPGDGVRAGREFGFAVLVGDRAVNNWHYAFVPSGQGTDVTESFRTIEWQSCGRWSFWAFSASDGICVTCGPRSNASRPSSKPKPRYARRYRPATPSGPRIGR